MRFSIAVTLFFFTTQAYSATVCTGEIDRVQVTKQGWLELISNDIYQDSTGRRLCSLHTVYETVEAETCQGWYSLLLASKAQSSEVRIQFYNGECNEQGTWAEAEIPHMISHN